MKKAQAVKFFGSQAALGRAIGVAQPTVSRWGERLPAWRQIQIEAYTNGELKADPGVVPANAKLVIRQAALV